MGSYQYYEFQAIDRPLDESDRKALRRYSSRAEITSRSFTNTYNYGDFHGHPRELVERWFDLHLYMASWSTRSLMVRLPAHLIDREQLESFVREVDEVEFVHRGNNLIVSMEFGEEISGYGSYSEWDEGEGWLDALAPLRSDLLSGDLRMFYVLWLTAVERGYLAGESEEPLPGIGPLSRPLQKFVEFFGVDGDLVRAAAEMPAKGEDSASFEEASRQTIRSIPEHRKTALLLRIAGGDPHVGAELRSKIRTAWQSAQAQSNVRRRTVAELVARASAVRAERKAEEARRRNEERRRKHEEAKAAQDLRLDILRRRGDRVWDDVEREINYKSAKSYDRVVVMLRDLRVLAKQSGTIKAFNLRMCGIRDRHPYKQALLRRLNDNAL